MSFYPTSAPPQQQYGPPPQQQYGPPPQQQYGPPPQQFGPPQDAYGAQGMAPRMGTIQQNPDGTVSETEAFQVSGSGGGLLSKIFSLNGLLTIGGIAAAAVAIKHFFFSGDKTQKPWLEAHNALEADHGKLKDASDKAPLQKSIKTQLKNLNEALKNKELSEKQATALAQLNEAYGYDPEDHKSYDASALDGESTDIPAAHTEFKKEFGDQDLKDKTTEEAHDEHEKDGHETDDD